MTRRLNEQSQQSFLYLLECRAVRIDQIEVTGTRNLNQVHIPFLLRESFLLGGDVIAAEVRWHRVVRRTANQPLLSLKNGKLHWICFAVVVRNFTGRAVEKLDHGIVAEVKLIRALQINHARQRNDAGHAGFVSGEAKRKLPSGGVPHHSPSSLDRDCADVRSAPENCKPTGHQQKFLATLHHRCLRGGTQCWP